MAIPQIVKMAPTIEPIMAFKWQYWRLHEPTQGQLDGFGEKGWELVAIDPKGNYVFKKPIEWVIQISGDPKPKVQT